MGISFLDPHWTEADYLAEKSMDDDLGMDAEGRFNLIPRLTPGFTGQTYRARYYSFWTWVIDEFRRTTSIKHNSRTFTEYLRRHENAMLLAYMAHGCDTSAVGVEQASTKWDGGTHDEYDVANWQALPSVSSGAYGQRFSAPLQAMNLTEYTGSYPVPTQPTGVRVAEAFRRSIEDTEYYRKFREAQTLPRDLIEREMAQHLCLCELTDFPEERRALIDVFFRFDTPDVYCVQRLATLCFFLDVIAQSNGARLAEGDLRRVAYFRVYEDGHAYVPEANLIDVADQWRVLQMQQYYRYAVESLWLLFLHGIYHEWKSLPEYLDWFWQGLELRALAANFGLDLPDPDPNHLTVEQFLQSVRGTLPDNFLDCGFDSGTAVLNEANLQYKLWETHKRPERQVYGGYALLLLSLIYLRFKSWHDEGRLCWELARYQRMNEPDRYNDDRLPPATYFDHVDKAQSAGWTLLEWIAWLHRRYLILQHKRVALTRLRNESQDLARFEYDDVTRRLYGRGLRWPSVNGLPWGSALGLLRDLGLVRTIGDRTYELVKPEGQALVDRFRTHVVPEHPEWKD
jgi:hypothetical protein